MKQIFLATLLFFNISLFSQYEVIEITEGTSSPGIFLNNKGIVAGNSAERPFVWSENTGLIPLQNDVKKLLVKDINDKNKILTAVPSPESSDPFSTPEFFTLFKFKNGNVLDKGIIQFDLLEEHPNLREQMLYGKSFKLSNKNKLGGTIIYKLEGEPKEYQKAFLFKKGKLEVIYDNSIQFLDLNEKNEVLGYFFNGTTNPPFFWSVETGGKILDKETFNDLGIRINTSRFFSPITANVIDDNGKVYGLIHTKPSYAFIWDPKTDEITILGETQVQINDVNDQGTVVGGRVVWEKGKDRQNLNDLIDKNSEWKISEAIAINNKGEILAIASKKGVKYIVLLVNIFESKSI